MEISHVLPENERNNFPNPREGLDPRFAMLESVEPLKSMAEVLFKNCADLTFEILRASKSKLTVKALLAMNKRLTDLGFVQHLGFSDSHAWTERQCEKMVSSLSVAVLKILANDGFIKLSNAADFEAREIVKYHATAEPKFKSGKFQL